MIVDANVSDIACGAKTGYFIKTDGSLWGYGKKLKWRTWKSLPYPMTIWAGGPEWTGTNIYDQWVRETGPQSVGWSAVPTGTEGIERCNLMGWMTR